MRQSDRVYRFPLLSQRPKSVQKRFQSRRQIPSTELPKNEVFPRQHQALDFRRRIRSPQVSLVRGAGDLLRGRYDPALLETTDVPVVVACFFAFLGRDYV